MLSTGCGGGDAASVDSGTGNDAAFSGKRVFVTAADFTGGFGTLDTQVDAAVLADQQCQTAAQGAGMSGTWHAWLSRFGTFVFPPRTAVERVTGDGPWHLTGSNELVFLNRSALANTPRVPINRNEHGVLVSDGFVWTGTDVGGTSGDYDCDAWHAIDDSRNGTVGRLSSTGAEWTSTGTLQNCNVRARLYCFQM